MLLAIDIGKLCLPGGCRGGLVGFCDVARPEAASDRVHDVTDGASRLAGQLASAGDDISDLVRRCHEDADANWRFKSAI